MLVHVRYHLRALEKQILIMLFPSLCDVQARSNQQFKLTNQLCGFCYITIVRNDVILGLAAKYVYNIFKMAATQQDALAQAFNFDNYCAVSLREKRQQGPGKKTMWKI